MGRVNEVHVFAGTVEARTSKAVLFMAHSWDEAMWFPLSQCHLEETGYGRNGIVEYSLAVPDWLADKKGVDENGES